MKKNKFLTEVLLHDNLLITSAFLYLVIIIKSKLVVNIRTYYTNTKLQVRNFIFILNFF